MPTNQLTCTTNMILSHYRHRLWGLQRSKVLKSILHCNWEIFISPGNSSALCLRDDRLPKFGCFFEKSLKSEYNVISNKLKILEDALFESSKTSTHKMEKLAH